MAVPSRLTSLPAELRNRIYRLALINDKPLNITSKKTNQEPALLATNRQIRAEALKIYYAENIFLLRVDLGYRFDKRTTSWFQSLAKSKRDLISKICVDYVNTRPGWLDFSPFERIEPLMKNWCYGIAESSLRYIVKAGLSLDNVEAFKDPNVKERNVQRCVAVFQVAMERAREWVKSGAPE